MALLLTRKNAKEIVDYYEYKECPTNEDIQATLDAHLFLAEKCKEYRNYGWVGGYYYEIKRYDLALKYYLIGDSLNQYDCSDGLGYIYFYGRTGDVDYKKAMHYYKRAYELGGNDEAGIKIADMYHHGYGVVKDDKKYRKMLFDILKKYEVVRFVQDPFPELANRIGQIYLDEGKTNKAKEIIFKGLSVIEQRLKFSTFWGNMIIARRLIEMYHQIVPLNEGHLTFIDLFYYFKEPNVAVLRFNNKKYFIEAFSENNEIRVKCDGKVYPSVEAFYAGCIISNHHVNVIEATLPFDMVSLDYENNFIGEQYEK